MNRDDVLKWKSGFDVAREMERRLVRDEAVDCGRSIRLALDLIDLCHRQGVWPISVKHSQIRQQEVDRVRERWRTLRKAFTK